MSKRQPAAPPIEDLDRLLVVGLGNPGQKYADTRHNIGFLVIDELARRHGILLSSRRYDGELGDGRLGTKRAALLKPQTYMNLSGQSVAQAVRYLGESTEVGPLDGGLVVIHDDVDLDLGSIRLKWAGGSAGHNGLRSIDQRLGSKAYFRVRLGVGRPRSGSVQSYVLSRFAKAEEATLREVVDGGADAIMRLLSGGLKTAQNEFHGRRFGPEPELEESVSRDSAG